jgi:hypothetical protein
MRAGLSSRLRHDLDAAAQELRHRHRGGHKYEFTSQFHEWTNEDAERCEGEIRELLGDAARGRGGLDERAGELLREARHLCRQGRLV